MTIENMAWTREPAACTMQPGRIEITTAPHTDLWQRTYYHFRNDNAPVLQMETDEKYFSFIVKTDFSESHHRFDQCGIVMYLDSENWLKGSVEYENESFQHLGSRLLSQSWYTQVPAPVRLTPDTFYGSYFSPPVKNAFRSVFPVTIPVLRRRVFPCPFPWKRSRPAAEAAHLYRRQQVGSKP